MSDQIRNREHRLHRSKTTAILRYTAPNGYDFTIDARPLDSGGTPHITSPAAAGCSATHITHTLGDGICCLAKPDEIRTWELSTLLFYIDAWARGMELYRQGYKFPGSPKEAFGRDHELR